MLQATSGAGGYGKLVWTYDPVGNRLTQTAKSVVTKYGYTKGSNRLASLTTGKAKQTIGTTAAGNISSFSPAMNAVTALSYNQANRLATVTTGTTAAATYTYDAFGQRLVKTPLGVSPILYQFDRGGNLLEEGYGSTTGPVDYIYLGTQPVATLTLATGTFSYLHTDHLGTPQLATGSTQAVAWSAGLYQPFGTTGTVTGTITQNLRLPGQYFDAESGFYHNGFRDYVPNLGRYLESDPIGLGGGLNTYLYANANPGRLTDRRGLQTVPLDPVAESGLESEPYPGAESRAGSVAEIEAEQNNRYASGKAAVDALNEVAKGLNRQANPEKNDEEPIGWGDSDAVPITVANINDIHGVVFGNAWAACTFADPYGKSAVRPVVETNSPTAPAYTSKWW